MLLETHVPQTTMGVTFGARLRSISLGLLDSPICHFDPKAARGPRNGSIWRSFGPPMSPRDALQTLPGHARGFIFTSNPRIYSVGEGAMHMKSPDDIGREAGIGRTQHRKELNVFRACP